MTSKSLPFAAGLVLSLLAAAPAAPQSNDDIQTGTQFNFSNPGGRSLAMAGAFLGLADDATAAYTNPAGLVQLAEPELSLEGRSWAFSTRFGDRGHTPLHELTGIGVDTIDGIQYGERDDETAGLSFLSYVHTGDRWAVAFYRHELARFEASILSQGPLLGPGANSFRVRPIDSHLELQITNFGASFAYRLSDDLSLGLGVSSYDFELGSLTRRFGVIDETGDFITDSLTGHDFGPADFRDENVFNTQLQEGDGDDVALNVGLLWRLTSRLSLGAVYRQGPEFDFSATFVYGPASGQDGEIDPEVGGDGIFHVPDVYGLGLAYRLTDSFVVSLDYDRVEYSDMTDEITNILRIGRGEPEKYVAEDADEIRLGFEFQALKLRYPLSFRFGAWHDPDHKIRYVGNRLIASGRFRPGEDEIHVSGGFGLVVHRTQIDVAVDLSDRVDTVSLSTVVRF